MTLRQRIAKKLHGWENGRVWESQGADCAECLKRADMLIEWVRKDAAPVVRQRTGSIEHVDTGTVVATGPYEDEARSVRIRASSQTPPAYPTESNPSPPKIGTIHPYKPRTGTDG